MSERLDNLTDKKGWKEAFIKALLSSPNVSAAARKAGVSRQYVYQVRDSDEAFRQEWNDAIEKSLDDLEESAFRRAKKGSDVLTIFLLKAHRPEIYMEKVRNELTGKDGQELMPVVVVQPGLIEKLK